MSNFYTVIKKLLPKGLAFFLKDGTQHQQFIEALGMEPERIKIFFDKVRDSGIPDGNLPTEALPDWETFLGLQQNSSLSDAEKNERIKGKYTAQGGQGPDYLEETLQAAGYPVYVVENPTGADPRPYLGILIAGPAVYDNKKIIVSTLGSMTLGSKKLGEYLGTRVFEIEKTISTDTDTWYDYWFLTGAGGLGNFVNIPIEKKQDFIKQVLQIKPADSWVVAQVNFT